MQGRRVTVGFVGLTQVNAIAAGSGAIRARSRVSNPDCIELYPSGALVLSANQGLQSLSTLKSPVIPIQVSLVSFHREHVSRRGVKR